jgi:DNA-binding GntR family transcriptional regulator
MVPGVTYSAPVLAERFGVSATPVREAMLDLINEGMIVAVPNKGFRIVETTDQDLDEMTELRRLIEVPTVGQIAKSITSEQVDGLRLIATRIMDAAAKGDVVTYIEADRQFHLELLRLSGNTRLVDLVDQLRMNTRLYGLEELAASGHLGRSSEEHLTLLDALEAGDRRGAERVMAQHLGHVRGIWANRHEQPSAVDE